MARHGRRLPKLYPDEQREFSHSCKGWIKLYGKQYRELMNCADGIKSSRRNGERMGGALAYCRSVFRDLESRGSREMSVIANCVNRGFSHGVAQSRRPR